MPHLTILHTNDLHGALERHPELVSRLAERRRALGSDGLLLDGGDAVSSGNVTFNPGGEATHDRMVEAGYDAGVVGNREFHFTARGFATKLKRALFPVLCANVRPRSGGGEPPAVPSIVLSAGGARVGVFGVTVPMVTERMAARHVSAWTFDPPVSVAARLAAELRGDCDLVVCLSHCGLVRDLEIAADVRDIDLVVGGHTHSLLEAGLRPSGALVVQAGAHGKQVGVVTVDIDAGEARLAARVEPL